MDGWEHFWHDHSRSRDAEVASVADNCRFEERVSRERWAVLEGMVRPTGHGHTDWEGWCVAAQTYLDERYSVSSLDVPDAFLELNQRAWLSGIEGNQTLVRVEDLGRVIDEAGYTLDDLTEFVRRSGSGDNDAAMAVREFVELWNARRDGRPAFAAFLDEVREEADAPDWAHALRDRLGLGHYQGNSTTPIPVAQMAYPVSTVVASAVTLRVDTGFALPTVLDGGMQPYYFPPPREHSFGAALHLDANHADMLTAEIIHCRIDYVPEHIRKVGRITIGHAMVGEELRDARDFHLMALRDATRREDFGELFDGRT